MSNKKYTPTDTGFREVEEIKKTVPTEAEKKEIERLTAEKTKEAPISKPKTKKVKKESAPKKANKIPADEDLSVPYPELGHSVKQLAGMEEHKRKSILHERDAEFVKKYL